MTVAGRGADGNARAVGANHVARGDSGAADDVIARSDVDACAVGESRCAGRVCTDEVPLHHLVRAALNNDANAITRNDIARRGSSSADAHPRGSLPEIRVDALGVGVRNGARGIGSEEAPFDRNGVGLDQDRRAPAIVDHKPRMVLPVAPVWRTSPLPLLPTMAALISIKRTALSPLASVFASSQVACNRRALPGW